MDSVYNEILSRRSNYYYYIGKVLEWPDASNPDTPENTQEYENEVRNKIISVKKVSVADVSYIVTRYNWETGTVYDYFDENYTSTYTSYSGATRLKDAIFYVLTSQFNVYKCLFNNNNSPSTIEPSGTEPTPITTADGYVWKYLYTIPLSLRTRFLSGVYMPVQKAVLNPYYTNGEIDRIIINDGGSGYLGNSSVSLSVEGEFYGGSGNSIANLSPVISASGSIERVIIDDAGANYKWAKIVVNDPDGTGDSFYKGLSNVLITDPGAGYDDNAIANTTATFVGTEGYPNSNAVVNLVFENESLVDVEILSPGNGYTSFISGNTTLTISTSGESQPTSNATANLFFANTAVFEPILFDGSIDSVLIKDPGINYSSNIQTLIVATGDGTGVTLLPYINQAGELEDVVITNRGEGYTYLNLDVIGDGTGANLSAVLSTGDLDTRQADVELSAIDGAIYSFRVIDRGEGYSHANVSIIGDGSGFQGNVVLTNSNSISHITVNNPGSGYTYANVIITGDGANANLKAILSPQDGHGSNPVKELFADTIMLYSSINVEKIHGLDVNNDYRQYGIIKDLKKYSNDTSYANAIGTPCILVTVDTLTDSLANALADDTVLELSQDTTRKFEVVETNPANTQILLTVLNNYIPTAGQFLNDPLTDSNYQILSVDRQPTINKFSGDLIYIDNRTSVSYSDDQLVTIRTILRI